MVLALSMIVLCGCSSAIRNSGYVPVDGVGWTIENGAATYVCERYKIRVGAIGTERLIVAGPVIPIVPFKHKYPGYLTLSISCESEDNNFCPSLSIDGKEIQAYEKHQNNSTETCRYRLGRDYIGDEKVSVSFPKNKHGCTIPALQFIFNTEWDYCLFCTA